METRATFIKTAFVGGEITPLMRGRSDLRDTQHGLQRCRNFLIARHGPARRRPGTRWVANAKSHSAASTLVPFAVSSTVQYMLEFGELVVRVYKIASGVPQRVGAFEITSPWTAAEAASLRFAQSADVLWICHPNFQPRTLARTGTDETLVGSWTLATWQNTDGPYLPINLTATTLTPSAVTGSGITITASASAFASTDVGRVVRIKHSAQWGAAYITGYTSATVVTATVTVDFSATTGSADWRLGVWHGATNWPTAVALHQGRIWFGSTASYPQSVWSSMVDDYPVFSPTVWTSSENVVTDACGISLSVDDDQVNTARWLRSDKVGLVLSTSGGVFVVAATNDAPLTPSNFTCRRHLSWGAHPTAEPCRLGGGLLMWQESRKLRDLGWSIQTERLDGTDIALKAEHLTKSGIRRFAVQDLHEQILWTLVGTGQLLACTFDRDNEVVAWGVFTTYNPPASLGASQTQAEVESICVTRSDSYDWLWLEVKRTVGGATKRFIEVLQKVFDHDDEHSLAWTLDCATQHDGASSSTITASHLPSTVVQGTASGGTTPMAATTVGGVYTFPVACEQGLVGIPFPADLLTVPIAVQAAYEQRGKRQRINKAGLQMWRSLGGAAGVSESKADPLQYRVTSDDPNLPPPLFTGIKELSMPGDWTTEPVVQVVANDPQPMTLVGLDLEVNIGGP